MACKAKFLQAVAAVVVVSFVAGKQGGNGPMPSSNRAPEGNPQTHGGGGGQYTSPSVQDAATGISAADGPKNNYYRDDLGSPRGEGVLVDVPNSESSRQLGDEEERNHVDFLKNKKPISNNITGAEIIPGTAVRKGPTTDAGTLKHGKLFSTDSVGAEVIPAGVTHEKNHVGVLKDKISIRSNVTGAEIIPGSAVGEGPTTDARTRKHGKLSSTDSVGAEVIPAGVTQEKKSGIDITAPGTAAEPERTTAPPSHKQEKNFSIDVIGSEITPGARSEEITRAINHRDEKKSSIDIVGAEVIPSNISERTKNFTVHKAKDGLPPRLDVVGGEVIPEGASKSNRMTPIKAHKPAAPIPVKASGRLEVTGNEVIPSDASKSYVTGPVKAHKPEQSKHNAPSVPNYEQITQSKGPGLSEVTSVKGLRSQRSTASKVFEPLRSPSVKAPRESKPPAVTLTKSRLRPCKEGLSKDLCSFQFHPGGRRHLITPEVLQRYLETGWAPVTTPTKETMHVCCQGKTQMIDFVGRDEKKRNAVHVPKAKRGNMYEEIMKMKRKLEKMQKENGP